MPVITASWRITQEILQLATSLSSKPTWDTVSKEGGWGEDGGGREQGEVRWEENERNMIKILYF